MTIEVEIAGTDQVAEFPDGTPPEVIQQALANFQPQEESFPGAGIIEPVAAIGSGIASTIAGGLSGLTAAPIVGLEEGKEAGVEAGAGIAKRIQEAGTYVPRTEAGQAGLELFGSGVEKGVDAGRFIVSGLAGLINIIETKGLDQAVETIESVKEQGLGETRAQQILAEGGSPEAATFARMLPDLALEIAGVGAARRAATAVKGKGKAAAETVESVFETQTPTKRRIARLIEEGSTDVETAKFKLTKPGQPIQEPSALQKFLDVGGPKVAKDKVAINAIEQGFDEGVIAAVKGASPTDKSKMLEMVDIMQRGKKNKRFAVGNRPSDVAGNSLLDRFRVVKSANRNAGQQLDKIAKDLKGQKVNFTPAIGQFLDDLEGIGVRVSDDLIPVYKGSDIEGVAGAERVVNQIIQRMKLTKVPDAHDVHRLKKFIDEQVTFGKRAEGLAGQTESILKSLRHNLDEVLDTNFPDYDRVNSVYAETISAMDALQDVAGRKLNLTGPNADKATGTLLRRLMSNAQSRVRLLDSVNEIDRVAKKHVGRGIVPFGKITTGVSKFDDDLLTQVLFVDELDSVFGPVARTSFQGQIDQALRQGVGATTTRAGAMEAGLTAAGKLGEKLRGINEENAFRTIKELLKEQ
jgi:hypothetical protein